MPSPRVFTLALALFLVSAVSRASAPAPAPSPAPAEALGRGSAVSLEYDHNPGDFSTILASGDFALSKKLGLLLSYRSDEVPEYSGVGHAWNAGAGAAYDFDRVFSANLGGEYQSLPGRIYARGGSLGVHANVGRWRFGLAARAVRYETDRPRFVNSYMDQRSLGIDVGYKLGDAWKIRASFAGYHYRGVTPEQLAALFNVAPDAAPGVQDTVEGMPRSIGTLGLLFLASDRWDLDLTFARTRYAIIPNSSSASFSANYQVTEAWGVGPVLTGLRQDTHRTGTVVGIQTSYSWD